VHAPADAIGRGLAAHDDLGIHQGSRYSRERPSVLQINLQDFSIIIAAFAINTIKDNGSHKGHARTQRIFSVSGRFPSMVIPSRPERTPNNDTITPLKYSKIKSDVFIMPPALP
jgi:hypothetical protein